MGLQLMAKSPKPFWEKKAPEGASSKLTSKEKSQAKARAASAGRPYPNLVDNAAVARRKEK
jgi:hypothetical protein